MPFLMGVHSSMMEVSEEERGRGEDVCVCARVWGSLAFMQLVNL